MLMIPSFSTKNKKNVGPGTDRIDELPFFRAQNLAAGYQGIPLIRGIQFRLEKGEILTLIGPNGAGKSTILKTLAGHLPSISGEILLKGRSLTSWSRQERARSIAVMTTDSPRTENMTARDVVEAGRYPYTGFLGILSETDHEAVRHALRTAHAEKLAEQDFMALSDGQRQRVRLARALAQEPELLILDEPTSWLDIRYQLELLDILRELCAERKTAVILSLHELFLAERVSDRIVCIKDGTIDRAGPPEEILSGDYPDALYDLPPGTYRSLRGREP